MIGQSIGTYRITSKLGAGGMGEVYRAHDTKLKRDVALKVLPEAFARDPERLARFEREAEVLASLNHPNIAAIYGVVEDRALVMELVEGSEPKGPLPFDEAWAIMSQVAAALDYAHEKGVVHRDLKPANIKVTPDGIVKLLDFGLAKAFSNQADSQACPENSPTLTIGATEAGVILGTAAYMSPEQAKSKNVDKRADIWAFGIVLHELLTGERLFQGDGVSETLAQVLTKSPDLGKIPARVQRLIQDCLHKDPKQRLRDIGDATHLLEERRPIEVPFRPRTARAGWIAAGSLALVSAIAFWGPWRARRLPEKPLVRFNVDLGPEVSFGTGDGASVSLSPDGTRILYVSQNRLFIRALDQAKATELGGTDGAFAPFFSPDGQWIGFFAGNQMKKVSVQGGASIALCDAGGNAKGGSWGEDGNIIAAISTAGALSQIPSSGGRPTPLTELAPGEATHRWPQVLPGGQAVLFTSHSATAGFDGANIDVISLIDHRRKTVQRGGTFGRYLPSGHLVFVNRGTLFAVPFDTQRLEVHGAPVPVLDEVIYSTTFGSAQLGFSQTGMVVYRGGRSEGGRVTVQWLDSGGRTQPLLAKPGFYLRPHLSPDGKRLALGIEGSNENIGVYEIQRDTMTSLTLNAGAAINPIWTPDGRYVLFRSGNGSMFWIRSNGAGGAQALVESKQLETPWSFTSDGKRLAFWNLGTGTGFDLWTVPLQSDEGGLHAGKPELFLRTPADERYPSFSPDGRWIAYSSDESGTYQVYVRAFPDKGGKWQISNSGGAYPVWSTHASELFFRGLDNRIMVASYTVQGDSFVVEKARLWFDKPLADFGGVGVGTYDLAPDGKRIAALMPVEEAGGQETPARNHVIFLENFFDELRRRAPADKK